MCRPIDTAATAVAQTSPVVLIYLLSYIGQVSPTPEVTNSTRRSAIGLTVTITCNYHSPGAMQACGVCLLFELLAFKFRV